MASQTHHRVRVSPHVLAAALIALGAASLSVLPAPAKANPAQNTNPCTNPGVLASGQVPSFCSTGGPAQPTPCQLAQVLPFTPTGIPGLGTVAGLIAKQELGCDAGGVPGRDTNPKNQAIQNRLQ
jgi:hypothetical protein